MMHIEELWNCTDPKAWNGALERYWDRVQRANMALEKAMDNLDLNRLLGMNERAWYEFLHDEYFPWKYNSDSRWFHRILRCLETYDDNRGLIDLDRIRRRLLSMDTKDIRSGLKVADSIKGLAIPGASGLLALMYPTAFATVDRFVVKALSMVKNFPEARAIAGINPDKIGLGAAVILIEIMRKKARDNNRLFATTTWTPRKIDMVLWACRES